MNKTLRWTLIIVGIVVVAAALVWGGVLAGRATTGWTGFGPGYTMMGGYSPNQSGAAQPYYYGMGPGMMGGFGSSSLVGIEPLSLDQARKAVEDYMAGLGNSDLTIGEVMVFDNQAYAQIVEKSTGIGAQEVLVDPV